NGKEIFSPKYKTVGFQNGLFKIEKADGTWNICDKTGAMKLGWTKATDVKITSKVVLFENADGNRAIIYDRSTWKTVQAIEITHDEMAKEVEDANRDKGTKIHGYETQAAMHARIIRTIPRYFAPKAESKAAIKRGDKEIVSWYGTGKWLDPHSSLLGWPQGMFPELGEDPYAETPDELYFLVYDTGRERPYLIWVPADQSDKYFMKINGEKCGYIEITPSPLHPTRLMMCRTEDDVEHPVWVWGAPLIHRVAPNDSWKKNTEAIEKREELAKAHLNCPHCIEQSRIYDEKNK
ncbi:MAG: hypothetical protein LBR08_10600, partial [Bacteroidales bacterium]|nr:hypothetical protein [Bacteroidales bacterium]